jgi:ABC-2 type transport system permease protein
MFNNTLLKTLYERRWSTIIWTLAMLFSVFLIMLLFPSLRDSLGASLKDVPESMQGLIGGAEDYQTITGYVDLQVIAQMIFLTIIMGVIVGTSLIAGDEHNGTLQTLMAQPISRASVFWQKFIALAVMTWFVAFVGLFLGVVLGVLALGETISYGSLALAGLMTWLVTLFFAVMAFGIGAATGKRGLAGIITGFYAFVGYMLTALSAMASSLQRLDYASAFHYFNNPSVLKYGLDYNNILVLLVGIVLFLSFGFVRFIKRDFRT